MPGLTWENGDFYILLNLYIKSSNLLKSEFYNLTITCVGIGQLHCGSFGSPDHRIWCVVALPAKEHLAGWKLGFSTHGQAR